MNPKFRSPNYDLHWFLKVTHISNIDIEPMHVYACLQGHVKAMYKQMDYNLIS